MDQEWTATYWDIIDDLYWSPKYLGLESVAKKHMVDNGEFVSIPKELTNPSGPLYRRTRFGPDYWSYVRRQEETFNHILNLVFAILPGDVIGDILNAISGQSRRHVYTSIGTEIRSRYHWKEQSNITTPDGFFIAEHAIEALEIKFDSPTSLDQLAKYVLLMICEEQKTGPREQLGLTYIFNSHAEATFERQIGVPLGGVNGALFDQMVDGARSNTVATFLHHTSSAARRVLDRLQVHCTDWQGFSQVLIEYSNALGPGPGDRTLRTLLQGLIYEIEIHPLSNVAQQTDNIN